MNLFERLLMRRLCEEAPVDGGPGGGGPSSDAPAADKPADAPADNPADAPKDGDKPGAEKTEAEVAAEKEAADKAAKENKEQGAPEKYEFTAAEGQTLDAEALAVFEPLARELGLTNEQGQKFVDAYASKILPQIQQQQLANWQKTVEDWAETVKADKEIGGDKLTANLGKAQQAVMQFGGEDLKQALQETGLGNHPALVKAFVKIGHAMSEDKMLGGGSNGEQLSAAQVLYGK
ncbi:peptidase [Pectobacterium versatile]|uniref:peptidase n=1 Tax=Pectobacterium versatile TaxID=2488639 RepID=UPI00102E8580|nr:peptidase [Pectobacterium versatile]TAI99813.1 peptidase [Pectobacterium versatile]UEQ10465.1 peptidase [Pectobacterium versatile]